MTSTREKVLLTLRKQPRRTINELAEVLGINPISVRHHIIKLQADGLVKSEEERHGVGRPHQVYYLSEAGAEQFPTRYIRLTLRLLEKLKETAPPELVKQLFQKMAQDLINDHLSPHTLVGFSLEERLDYMKNLLKQEGFNIEWERHGDQYQIHEASCPYFQIGQDHPEICTMGQTIFSSVLAVSANKTKCILNGDSICTFIITNPELMEVKNE